MIKKILMFSLLGICLVCLLYSVSALGITPSRTVSGFYSGESQTVVFSVINTEHKDMDISIYAQGELNQSIFLPVNSFKMSANEYYRTLNYTFTSPSSLSPGGHFADIIVLSLPQKAESSNAFVGSTVAVVSQLLVNVRYPGKYIKADLNILEGEQNTQTVFTIPIINLGELDISKASAVIDIYDNTNKKIDSIQTDSVSLGVNKRIDLVSKWNSNAPIGKYKAVATVNYDGKTISIERDFQVGKQLIEITEINVPNFKLGDIAKFDIHVINRWNENINRVYSDTQVYSNNGEIIGEFRSPSYDLIPSEDSVMNSYWDTKGIKIGEYNATISLIYGEKNIRQNVIFKITEDSITAIGLGYTISNSASTLTGRGLLLYTTWILIIIAIIAFIWLLISKKNRQN